MLTCSESHSVLVALVLGSCLACTPACKRSRIGAAGERPSVEPVVLPAGAEAARAARATGPIAIRLERIAVGPGEIAFGLPLGRGLVRDASSIRVSIAGKAVDASVEPLLYDRDATGAAVSLGAVMIQLPRALMPRPTLDLTVELTGGHAARPAAVVPFAKLSVNSTETATVVDRTIVRDARGDYRLKESNPRNVTLFTGREPAVIAHFPAGYLAHTGLLGPLLGKEDVAADPNLAGLGFLSEAVSPFVRSALYHERYALNPDAESVVDPVKSYEGWLYDRCATLLVAHAYTNDFDFLRHALRACSFYAGKIALTGENAGIFSGKPDPDPKYSHARGLYAYYALTGDEQALSAIRAIADMWLADRAFVAPYRSGHLRGPDKLWTERLLAAALEGLYYGHRATGDKSYLKAFQELFATAYRHVTTADPRELVAIDRDPNQPPFPPQDCFVHNAAQHAEGETTAPWCSGWMTELLIDPLLAYQAATNDPRVDEIFVRLSRSLRKFGTAYFDANPLDDTFLSPSVCYDAERGVDQRRLVPLYGAALGADGKRVNSGEFSDSEHCADATALTAVALRALRRQGKLDAGGPIGPFRSEGAALGALHGELAWCARLGFEAWNRKGRDPSVWTSAELAPGAADPATFIAKNKIGFPSHPTSPERKLSWWFSSSLLEFQLLRDAGARVPVLEPGVIQPAGKSCPSR